MLNNETPRRDDYSLYNYYVHPMVSSNTHDLIRKIPAFIAASPDEKCEFYIIPDTFQSSQPPPANINTIKYGKRSQKMFNKAITTKTTATDSKSKSNSNSKSQHETILKSLKKYNPNILTLKESKITKICKTWQDPRIDKIMKERKRNRNGNDPKDISFFLTDKYGLYKVDQVIIHSMYSVYVVCICFEFVHFEQIMIAIYFKVSWKDSILAVIMERISMVIYLWILKHTN